MDSDFEFLLKNLKIKKYLKIIKNAIFSLFLKLIIILIIL